MILHLHLVRHGQTYFNRYNRLQGWTNAPLTQQGIADAHEAARKLAGLKLSAAYCSDTTRAQQTARIIVDENTTPGSVTQVISSPYFREQFYGYFEGQDMALAWYAAGAPHGAPTYQAIVQKFGLKATKDFLKEADPFHDAESNDEYWHRIAQGYALIAHDAVHGCATHGPLHDGDDVLQISHGNTLLSLMNKFAGAGYDLSHRPQNGSVTTFDFDTDADFDHCLHVVSFNQ
jgi:broad specificity phosphatase PhoE